MSLAVAEREEAPEELILKVDAEVLKITLSQQASAFFICLVRWRCTDWVSRHLKQMIVLIVSFLKRIVVDLFSPIRWTVKSIRRIGKYCLVWLTDTDAYKSTQKARTWQAGSRLAVAIRTKFQARVVNEDEANMALRVDAFARVFFYFGVLANFADGILTWIAVNTLGIAVEGNGFMGRAMHFFGYQELITFKIVFGTFIIWIMSNSMRGRRFFVKKSHALDYRVKMMTGKPIYFNFTALCTNFAYTALWFVVGNDYRAVMVLFHKLWW